jgi:hypothetical protein
MGGGIFAFQLFIHCNCWAATTRQQHFWTNNYSHKCEQAAHGPGPQVHTGPHVKAGTAAPAVSPSEGPTFACAVTLLPRRGAGEPLDSASDPVALSVVASGLLIYQQDRHKLQHTIVRCCLPKRLLKVRKDRLGRTRGLPWGSHTLTRNFAAHCLVSCDQEHHYVPRVWISSGGWAKVLRRGKGTPAL